MRTANEISRLARRRRRAAHGWNVTCPAANHQDNDPSCWVIDGEGGPFFYCRAGCDWRDVRRGAIALGWIDAFSARHRSSQERALAEAAAQARRLQAERKVAADKARGIEDAHPVFSDASSIQDTAAERYLRMKRRIKAQLPPVLRFGKHTWHDFERRPLPALVARIECPLTREFRAAHCTLLTMDGDKAGVMPPRLTPGAVKGGVIGLAKPARVLAIGEGVESSLSFAQLSGLPTWAGISAGNLTNIELPDLVQEVVIAADHDERGLACAQKAADRWIKQGRTVTIAPPRVP